MNISRSGSGSNSTASPLYRTNQVQHFKEDQMPSPGLHQHANHYHYSSDHFGSIRTSGGSTATSTTAADIDEMAVATLQKQQPEKIRKLQQLPVIPEDIDQSAEAFVRKFRQQLVIQRMQSIENYEKMLARET